MTQQEKMEQQAALFALELIDWCEENNRQTGCYQMHGWWFHMVCGEIACRLQIDLWDVQEVLSMIDESELVFEKEGTLIKGVTYKPTIIK